MPLDPKTAKAYRGARPEEKKKCRRLSPVAARPAAEKPATLNAILDEVPEKAIQRGLTPKILDALLKGA